MVNLKLPEIQHCMKQKHLTEVEHTVNFLNERNSIHFQQQATGPEGTEGIIFGFTEMFPLLHQELLSSAGKLSTVSPPIQSHLDHLQGYFWEHFPDLENIHLNWVRDHFASAEGSCLDLLELIEMTNSEMPSPLQMWDCLCNFENRQKKSTSTWG